MDIQVVRPNACGETCTISKCTVDGEFKCYILEDVMREIPGKPVSEWKVYGKTAIPRGTYKVTMTFSQHFDRVLPLLNDVPGYGGVRIHPGNSEADTEGCLLPGMEIGADGETVLHSRDAFGILLDGIKGALDSGEEVLLTIG